MEVLIGEAENPQMQLWVTKLKNRIEFVRLSLLKLFRLIVQYRCLEPLQADV